MFATVARPDPSDEPGRDPCAPELIAVESSGRGRETSAAIDAALVRIVSGGFAGDRRGPGRRVSRRR